MRLISADNGRCVAGELLAERLVGHRVVSGPGRVGNVRFIDRAIPETNRRGRLIETEARIGSYPHALSERQYRGIVSPVVCELGDASGLIDEIWATPGPVEPDPYLTTYSWGGEFAKEKKN